MGSRTYKTLILLGVLIGLVYVGYMYIWIKPVPPSGQELYTKSILMIGSSWLQLVPNWKSLVPKETTYSGDWAFLRQSEEVGMIGIRYKGEPIHRFRAFVGAIRRVEPEMPIHLVVSHPPPDFIEEASKWVGVTVAEDTKDWTAFDHLDIYRPQPHDMFEKLNEESRPRPGCYLHSTWERPPTTHPANAVPKFCMCVSVFNNGRIPIKESSFFDVVLKSFMRTTRNDTFDFHFYVGFQNDTTYDHPGAFVEFSKEFNRITNGKATLHAFRYPLMSPLMDITRKFNLLIDDAYREGCDYMYQYSDDTLMIDDGWATALVDCLQANDGLGAGGMVDLANKGTVTLSMAGRKHIEIFGSYWPITYTNWFSDDWVQHIYEPWGAWCQRGRMRNMQTHGQRYKECTNVDLSHDIQVARSVIKDYLSSFSPLSLLADGKPH